MDCTDQIASLVAVATKPQRVPEFVRGNAGNVAA